MTMRTALAFVAILGALGSSPTRAGPCADDLYRADLEVGKRLDEIAGRGKPAAESTFATTHHQPTPATIAGAEAQVGDISESQLDAVRGFMVEAHKADEASDKAACEKAISGARNILGM